MKRLGFVAPILLAASLLLVACGDDDDSPSTPSVADGVTEVVRQILAEADPDTASGQVLQLTRVIIPADEGIAPHTHPGPQLAVIVSGTLTYTVIDGEATVTRNAGLADAKVEPHKSGDTFELHAGDSIMENTKMVHEAANKTGEPVVIYLSSLFPQDEPPATLVE